MMLSTDFPHSVYVKHAGFSALIGYAAPLIVNVVAMLAFGLIIPWQALFFILLLLPLAAFAMGLGLVMSLFRVVLADLVHGVDNVLKLVMFVTPIVYSRNLKVEWLKPIIEWNPLTYLIGVPRDIFLMGNTNDLSIFFMVAGVSFLFFFAAYWIFGSARYSVVERLMSN